MDVGLIDPATRRRLIERFGPGAASWCRRLPGQVDHLARRWGFTVIRSVSSGSNSCVLLCERPDDGAVVLKLSPDRTLGIEEVSALAAWRASGRVPKILESDEGSGALLMEAIRPGTVAAEGRIAIRPGEIAALVRDLHAAGGDGTIEDFPPLIERVEFIFALFDGRLRDPRVASRVSPGLMERSLAVARNLANAPGRRVLLHGDLHPRNVLDGGNRGLVAVDPRACVGDPAFDLIDWVFSGGVDRTTLVRRAERLADEAGADRARLWRWCGCTAVLIAIVRLLRGTSSDDAVQPLLALANDEV